MAQGSRDARGAQTGSGGLVILVAMGLMLWFSLVPSRITRSTPRRLRYSSIRPAMSRQSSMLGSQAFRRAMSRSVARSRHRLMVRSSARVSGGALMGIDMPNSSHGGKRETSHEDLRRPRSAPPAMGDTSPDARSILPGRHRLHAAPPYFR